MSHQYGYILVMNDMRMAQIEMAEIVCWAETEQELRDFLVSEKVETYETPRSGPFTGASWGKTFAEGGPLEWYNDCANSAHFGHGVRPYFLPPRLQELRT